MSQENAFGVAGHLVMVARLIDTDLEAALAHAETAVRRAGRVPATREALGLVAYRRGDWASALTEFRTARRLSGSDHLLPYLVDCERALGRPARALALAASPEAQALPVDEAVELAIVVSGIRRDAGQAHAAAAALELPQLRARVRRPWTARLRYAYAEAQLALGDPETARTWFARAAAADDELTTDAAERLEELDGITYADLDADADAAAATHADADAATHADADAATHADAGAATHADAGAATHADADTGTVAGAVLARGDEADTDEHAEPAAGAGDPA